MASALVVRLRRLGGGFLPLFDFGFFFAGSAFSDGLVWRRLDRVTGPGLDSGWLLEAALDRSVEAPSVSWSVDATPPSALDRPPVSWSVSATSSSAVDGPPPLSLAS